MIKVGKYTLDDNLIVDMKMLIENSILNNIEYGFNLYINLKNPYLFERGNICTGTKCDVILHDSIKETMYVPIGSFHTHIDTNLEKEPGDDLSIDDLYDILSHEMTCVGFKHNKLACYIVNMINDETYLQNLRNDSHIIKEYVSKSFHDKNSDLTLKFYDAWDRAFSIYLSIYYIDLNAQTIEL